MALPQLPDLPDFEPDKAKNPPKKKVKKKKAVKKSEKTKNEDNEKSDTKKRPTIPKTEYDAEGKPMLMVPDLNDVELTDEIERFFG